MDKCNCFAFPFTFIADVNLFLGLCEFLSFPSPSTIGWLQSLYFDYTLYQTIVLPFSAFIATAVLASKEHTKEDHDGEHSDTKVKRAVQKDLDVHAAKIAYCSFLRTFQDSRVIPTTRKL